MEQIRILSVDWDYFVQAMLDERIDLFPDGGDYPNELEKVIWVNHYVKDALTKLKVSHKEINSLKACLLQSKPKYKAVMLCNSHYHIYNFITTQVKPDCKIELYNIDFHHDVYTDSFGTRIDCGNWLAYLLTKYKGLNAKWVARETSDRVRMAFPLKEVSLNSACTKCYDYIFVSRSGLYSPPHLDEEFCRLFTLLTTFNNCTKEQNILQPRNDASFYASVEQLKKFLVTFNKK